MKKLRLIKAVAIIIFLISLFYTIDLGINLLYNAETSIHDGSFSVYSILHAVFGIFGDSLWSYDRFFLAFKNASWITYALLVVNVVLYFFKDKE